MTKNRTIVIGDVHGCLRELNALLDKLNYDPKPDRLIFVGDLINKGPDSLGVLRRVRDLKVEVVLGNHELGFLRRTREKRDHPLRKAMGKDVEDWCAWIESWPLFIEDDDFIVVHGGIAPHLPLHQSPAEVLTKIRTWDGVGEDLQDRTNPPWYELYQGEKLVVYGHWADQGLIVRDRVIGLDSGCVYGNELSAVSLPTLEITQVKAAKEYCPIFDG